MTITKIWIIAVFFACILLPVRADENDSLRSVIALMKNDTAKVNALLELGDMYERNKPDTALKYYHQALKLAEECKSSKHRSKSLIYLGVAYKNTGEYEKALDYYNQSLQICSETDDSVGIAKCYNNIGTVYIMTSDYNNAINYIIKTLKIYERLGDRLSIAKCNINIGNIYFYQDNYKRALEYFGKSLEVYETLLEEQPENPDEIKFGLSYCYLNNGISCLKLGDLMDSSDSSSALFDTAMVYLNRSLELFREFNNKQGMANCYSNIGAASWKQKNYTGAIAYYKKSLEMKELIGDNKGIALDLANIAYGYIILSDSVSANSGRRTEYLGRAVTFGTRSLEIAKKHNMLLQIRNTAGYLKLAHEKLGNTGLALQYANMYIDAQDSLFLREKTQIVNEVEAKYQNEKKQLEIEKLENDRKLQGETIARQEAENKKQRNLIISFIIGLILLVAFAMVLYRLFLQKRRANIALEDRNRQITAQKEEIEKQKNYIESIFNELSQSIEYAKRIQKAIMPDKQILNDYFADSFIFFRPRNVVSGDFYWFTEIDGKIIVACADCTGHGVPGAFMSLLGIAFLKEIVVKEHMTDPGRILELLREEIIRSLKQQGTTGEPGLNGQSSGHMKDGMDIALCTIDTETRVCLFAGANNPVYMIRNKQLSEISGNKMPISIYDKMDRFTTNEIRLDPGDCLYLFSDGFADQFGGTSGGKFKYKPFRELLLEISCNSMPLQHETLSRVMDEWKQDYDQVDDMLVIGIKIK
ncbi:MAG: tetratricopeptide repeat protein [Bacteroidota bacterium]